jgi:hypothetical protein
MQIRCANCGRPVPVAGTGILPERCPHCAAAPVPAALGRWRIERLLAAGGMGEVYLARHHQLGTRVALKLLPRGPGLAEPALMRERFAREAVLTATIDHPGVVRVLDFEQDGELAFLVLELVQGRSLRSLLGEGALPIERALALAAAVAEVVAAAHDCGVVHRDLKPENVMVADDGRVRVLDFGIARALQDQEPLTRTGEILGTPEYMAPEQLLEAADAVDARTDVHALGLLTYELLTGISPFRGSNLFQTLKLVEALEPGPPSARRQGVPAAVDALVVRAMQKDREARPADAAAFAAQLRASTGPAGREAERAQPRGFLLATALALGLGIGWSIAASLRGSQAAGAPAEVPADPLAAAWSALRSGAFRAALARFERAARSGVADAAEPAAVAWLGSQLLLPAAAGAPSWLAATDAPRRHWLFAEGADAVLPDSPLARACRALAAGDPRAALAELEPAPGQRLAEPAATVALLAAHAVCADRELLRSTAADWRPRQPWAGYLLLEAGLGPAAESIEALRAQAAELEAGSADRWMLELYAAYRACRAGEAGLERLRALAELAWLTGGGEPAIVTYVGLRLDLAACRPECTLGVDAAERAQRLVHGLDPMRHPTLGLIAALLRTARDPAAEIRPDLPAPLDPALAAFVGWRDADDPAEQKLWNGIARHLVGDARGAAAAFAALEPHPDALLLRAAVEPDLAEAGRLWTQALAAAPDLELLGALAWRAAHAPAAIPADLSDDRMLPTLRACLRLGARPDGLLDPAWSGRLREGRWRAAYIDEVQGGIDR